MARRNIQFVSENYYHIYNRGNNKEPIFLEDENYRYFLSKLHLYLDRANIDLVAYCLMPNHFHLLIYLNNETNFSNIMRSFTLSYVKSFNLWHGRVGHLFQGDFKAKHVTTDEYLTILCAYIHCNPVNAHLVMAPELWKYSDYSEWIVEGVSKESHSITLRNQLFGNAKDYQKFVAALMEDRREQEEFEKWLFG